MEGIPMPGRVIAHVRPTDGQEQLLEEHLRSTARLARACCSVFEWCDWAHYAGLWHDLGKYSDDFQRRIRGDPRRVDHSTAGAQHAVSELGDPGRLLAYCIAGHHAGLPDGACSDESDPRHRLKKLPPSCQLALRSRIFLKRCLT